MTSPNLQDPPQSTSTMTTTNKPEITLYWLNDSRAQRIVWLLEELDLPYTIKTFWRTSSGLAPPELERIHPLGKSPVLAISFPFEPHRKAIVLAESGFIVQYLCDHFSPKRGRERLVPERWVKGKEGEMGGETEGWMRHQYLLHYAEGSFALTLVIGVVLSIFESKNIPFFIRPVTGFVANKIYQAFVLPNAEKHIAFLDGMLATTSPSSESSASEEGGRYLCGGFLTAVDILLSFNLITTRDGVGKMMVSVGEKGKQEKISLWEKYPRVGEYLERLQQEEGYLRAEETIKAVEGKQDKGE
ncbi:hypothetical protein QBC36DRAFT_333854 [Triangularia setosa]|uniref:GST N-terminal domain-containing protein n=1 Tax=Triangularia setosa TaxID=2587417 RepID=A0AAN6W4T7_9PEZI|nr:hypothetical protein QBC36DRAFT_333854 [Podospora setosa]